MVRGGDLRLSLVALSRQERAPPFLEGIPCRRLDFSASASFAGALEDTVSWFRGQGLL